MSDQNPSQQEPQPETVAYYEQQGQEQQSREHQQPLQQVPEQQPQPQAAAAPATPAAPTVQETCPICNEPVLRIHHKVKHGGHTYHSKCFVCSLCGEKLAGKPFFTEKEKRICKDCYASKVAPKCAQCGEAVTGEQVKTSDGKIYHPQCFRCFRCNKVIPGSYRTDRKTGKPEHAYNCIEDDPTGDDAAADQGATPAQPGQSGAPDQGTSGGEQARKASAGGANRCRDCGKDLVNCKYFILDDGMKVCDKCFKHNHCATCRKCGKAIMSGQSHTVKDWKFHKECFNCPVCGTYMGDKPLKIQNGYVCLDSCDPSQLPPGGGQQNGQ